jgi:hypothetical protein
MKGERENTHAGVTNYDVQTETLGHRRISRALSVSSGGLVAQREDTSRTAAPPRTGGLTLFVSTSLAQWETTEPHRIARDFQINDTIYRRLDPEYFAWLRGRMTVAQRGVEAGAIRPEVFDRLRERFNRLQEHAIAIFGEPAIKEAIRRLVGTRYRPPHVTRSDTRTVTQQSRGTTEGTRTSGARDHAEVQAIIAAVRDRALARGWREKRVWGEAGQWSGGTLADALRRPGTRIGQITRQWIEIIGPPPHQNVLRFYNPDVEQPWIKRV